MKSTGLFIKSNRNELRIKPNRTKFEIIQFKALMNQTAFNYLGFLSEQLQMEFNLVQFNLNLF